jgi:hypothetical protein
VYVTSVGRAFRRRFAGRRFAALRFTAPFVARGEEATAVAGAVIKDERTSASDKIYIFLMG